MNSATQNYGYARAALLGAREARERNPRVTRWIVFWAAHAPLGILAAQSSLIATVHSALAVAVALWLALFGKRLRYVAYAGAYIVGAEVLWRMTRSQLFWETGKYATVLIFVVALVRLRRAPAPKLPLAYFLLLLPSALPLILEVGFAGARQAISFNLSGPLTLLLCAWFFSRTRFTAEGAQGMFMSLAAPAVGIAAITAFNLLTNTEIVFTGESNRDVTGGFGPNQVSAALGLGALVLLFCVLYERRSKALRLASLAFALFFLTQAALTFSRGGIYNALGAGALASLFLMKDARTRAQMIVVGIALVALMQFVLLPQLDAFTGGALQERLENVDPTGRTELLEADLEIWYDNPIFGVGPGQATPLREELTLVAHTEFSRLLSEHGMFGLISLFALLGAGWAAFVRADGAESKAVVVATVTWSFLFMLNAAMRTAAPGFIFGLAHATYLLSARRKPITRRERRLVPLPTYR